MDARGEVHTADHQAVGEQEVPIRHLQPEQRAQGLADQYAPSPQTNQQPQMDAHNLPLV